MHCLFLISTGRQPHAFEVPAEELIEDRTRNTKMFFPLSMHFSVVQHFLTPILQTRIRAARICRIKIRRCNSGTHMYCI